MADFASEREAAIEIIHEEIPKLRKLDPGNDLLSFVEDKPDSAPGDLRMVANLQDKFYDRFKAVNNPEPGRLGQNDQPKDTPVAVLLSNYAFALIKAVDLKTGQKRL